MLWSPLWIKLKRYSSAIRCRCDAEIKSQALARHRSLFPVLFKRSHCLAQLSEVIISLMILVKALLYCIFFVTVEHTGCVKNWILSWLVMWVKLETDVNFCRVIFWKFKIIYLEISKFYSIYFIQEILYFRIHYIYIYIKFIIYKIYIKFF